jgi:tetratricopeptide (TPR) repeat protein
MTYSCAFRISAVLIVASIPLLSQASPRGQAAELNEPRRFNPIASTTSAEEIEHQADDLRAGKRYFDALDRYRAALAKEPNRAVLFNKMGIAELSVQRFRAAKADFESAVRLDRQYAAAYNNLGVVDYALKKYGRAVKQYQSAIRLDPESATYYGNLGTAYFSKKDWEKSIEAYRRAAELDPDVFERTSAGGVAGHIASPEDRAHFSYLLARLYARQGLADRALEYLRRALEEGYEGVNEAYKDAEFTELRKDVRFVQLMTARPVSIPK